MSKQNAAGAAPQENKMGVLPVGKLLAGMAVPMMISMLVQALYNIVDSVFVSRLSENAFNAVGLAFPLQSLMIAVGAGTAVGINALLSRSLGEKKQEMADRAAARVSSCCPFAAILSLPSSACSSPGPFSWRRPRQCRRSWNTACSTPGSA